MPTTLLKYPFYRLFYLEDLASYNGFSTEELEVFRATYDAALRAAIVQALTWVAEHPEADLHSVYPNLPFANDELHEFSRKTLRSLLQEGGGLPQ